MTATFRYVVGLQTYETLNNLREYLGQSREIGKYTGCRRLRAGVEREDIYTGDTTLTYQVIIAG